MRGTLIGSGAIVMHAASLSVSIWILESVDERRLQDKKSNVCLSTHVVG